MKDFYYVTLRNNLTNETTLLGFNLTEDEKDKLFYTETTDNIHYSSTDRNKPHLMKSWGCHSDKFKTKNKAIKELITKPNEIQIALDILEKYGLVAYEKTSKINSYFDL